jgi:hypothetical protein
LLQRALGRVAANPLIATLLWSLVAYDVRKCPPDRTWASIDSELGPVECRIVTALALDQAGDAELELCRAQQLISELMLRTRHQ